MVKEKEKRKEKKKERERVGNVKNGYSKVAQREHTPAHGPQTCPGLESWNLEKLGDNTQMTFREWST